MTKDNAKQILEQSISNLYQRRGSLTSNDLEAEVINNACLYILKNQKNKMREGSTFESIFMGTLNAIQDSLPIAKAFTDGAMELFPEHYSVKEATVATTGIQQNVAWNGMWDFLRDYFQKNHGIQIDEVETDPTIFYSSKHKRYENNSFVSESEVERTINLNFVGNKEELIVGIAPSLSPKKCYKLESNGNSLKYKGYDPDYLFIVTYDDFDEVEQFILEMPNRGLKIVYFE